MGLDGGLDGLDEAAQDMSRRRYQNRNCAHSLSHGMELRCTGFAEVFVDMVFLYESNSV